MFEAKKILKYGSKGPDVVALQSILASQGYFSGWCGGNFLKLTKGALVDFQMQHIDPATGRQLAVDGEVWPGYGTERALNNPSGSKQRSGFGSSIKKSGLQIPAGIGLHREAFISAALADYKKGIREIPDGSNGGDGVDRYLHGIGRAYWCCFAVSEFYRDAFGEWPLGERFGHCLSFRNAAKSAGAWMPRESRPIPGDIFIMVTNARTASGHTGIVYRVGDRGFNAIEGNCGNRLKVTYRDYTQDSLDGYISLFCRPDDFERGLTRETTDFLDGRTR